MNTKKFIIVLSLGFLASFLGSFFASYTLLGQLIHPNYSNAVFADDFLPSQDKLLDNMNRRMEEFDKAFDHLYKEEPFYSEMPLLKSINKPNNNRNMVSIKTDEDKDSYKLTISLKPFDNNDKNVKISVKDNNLIVSANYEKKEKQNYSSSLIYQSFNLPEKVDALHIKKAVKDDNMVIIIPKASSQKKV